MFCLRTKFSSFHIFNTNIFYILSKGNLLSLLFLFYFIIYIKKKNFFLSIFYYFYYFFILFFFYFIFLGFLEIDNTSSNSATIPVLRCGLRRQDIQNKDFILIFIHDLQSWSVSKLWEFLSKRISNCNEIVHGITKKHTPNMENYFILRINYVKPT